MSVFSRHVTCYESKTTKLIISQMPEAANSEAQRDEDTRIDDFEGSRESLYSFNSLLWS